MYMTYEELREKHQAETNAFPLAAAFNDKQLEEAMKRLDVKSTDELLHVGGGTLIRKTDRQRLHDMLDRHERELKEAMQDNKFLKEAFIYELGNHEYCITMDPEDTLDALNIEINEFATDKRMQRVFREAERDYLKSMEYLGY